MLKKVFIPFLAVSFLLIGCNGADEEVSKKRPGFNPQPPVEQPEPEPVPDPDLTKPIAIEITNPNLFVTGVGEADTTQVIVTLLDDNGKLIKDPSGNNTNIRVSFESRPNGGEMLNALNKRGDLIQGNEFIDLASQNGRIAFSLRSGTLPGVSEIRVTLIDEPWKTAVSPKINISSGPAEAINFSFPFESIINLGNGFYQRLIGVTVTDKWGNSVPDGTVVNLGVLDSVILSNINPTVNANVRTSNPDTAAEIKGNNSEEAGEVNSSILRIGNDTVAENASITRNNTARFIEKGDRVLLWNAQAADKLRFVSALSVNDLLVNKPYLSNQNNLDYLVGVSLVGASISGEDLEGNRLVGQLRTRNGLGQAYLTYPANNNTINLGCGFVPFIDQRYLPMNSAQVWITAESNQGKATTINSEACFSALAPLELINFNDIDTISSSASISLAVRDASNINVPYQSISTFVTIEESAPGFSVSVTPCFEGTVYQSRTSRFGSCVMDINVVAPTDPEDSASAKVVFRVDESEAVEIEVKID